MKKLFLFILAGVLSAPLFADLESGPVEYKQGETVCEGYLSYDNSFLGKRPGVLVVHEWMGLGRHAKEAADKLAEMGYVALAVDIYGQGVRPKNVEEAGKLSKIYKDDRALMRARIKAGLDVLNKNPLVDSTKLAAIGYCFGGTAALELARSGAKINGVVSFHGGLDSPNPADAKNIKAKVLVLHGADDPYVGKEAVLAFEDEMRKAGVDWQLNLYSDAVHSFTNIDAGTDKSKGAAYNEKADRRSWEAMKLFFAEIFK